MKKWFYPDCYQNQYYDVKVSIDWYKHHRRHKYKAFTFTASVYKFTVGFTVVYKNPNEYPRSMKGWDGY